MNDEELAVLFSGATPMALGPIGAFEAYYIGEGVRRFLDDLQRRAVPSPEPSGGAL